MNEFRQTIEQFLAACRKPVLCEAGEESVAITADNFVLEERSGALTLQAWDEHRNLVRRVTGIEQQTRNKLVLRIERFGKRLGTIALMDLARGDALNIAMRGNRREFRELFRRFLHRNFATYRVAELTTEADLQHSLSPIHPRALLRLGNSAWAAIAAPPDGMHGDGVLTFGLIWLDYLRRRDPDLNIQGLILYLPAGRENVTCLRLAFLDRRLAQYAAFVYTEDGLEQQIDLNDSGNLDTRLERCQRRIPGPLDLALEPIRQMDGVESIERSDGELSLRVRGLEFARSMNGELLTGLHARNKGDSGTALRFAQEMIGFRSPDAPDRFHPLYLRNPESWLESQVRSQIESIDAGLLASPVYGQVPAFAAADRAVLDLLAVDREGRLAVIELKASEDIHLPLQALDYWMRVKWHLDRGEFTTNGYFPGIQLRSDPPRLLLVAPALQFHPANETVLRFLSSNVAVARIGVGVEWQRSVKVMFRR